MMRTVSTIAILICLVAVPAFPHHGPKSITIKAAAKKQPAVTFNHDLHGAKLVKTCETCHHTEKGLTATTDAKVKKCTTCHLDPKDAAPSMREMSLTKNPFHSLCLDCHKKAKKGPTTCVACHKKS